MMDFGFLNHTEVARVLGVTEEEVEEIAVREGMIPKVPKGRN